MPDFIQPLKHMICFYLYFGFGEVDLKSVVFRFLENTYPLNKITFTFQPFSDLCPMLLSNTTGRFSTTFTSFCKYSHQFLLCLFLPKITSVEDAWVEYQYLLLYSVKKSKYIMQFISWYQCYFFFPPGFGSSALNRLYRRADSFVNKGMFKIFVIFNM